MVGRSLRLPEGNGMDGRDELDGKGANLNLNFNFNLNFNSGGEELPRCAQDAESAKEEREYRDEWNSMDEQRWMGN